MTDDNIDPEQLSELQSQVAKLPRTADAPDVWPQIRAAIESDRVKSLYGSVDRIGAWQRPRFLAAAAVLLVVASSGITLLTMKQRATPDAPIASAPLSVSANTPVALVQFTARENDYIRSANQLSQILAAEEGRLAPGTVSKLRASIAVIDAAILEARRALAADPANSELIEILSSSYDKKLDLLRRTAALARS